MFVTSEQQDETVMIDSERLRRVRRWPVGDAAGSVSPDGRLFALGSSRGEVRVLDLRSGRVRRFTGGKAAAVSRLAFTPDRRTLVTSHDDGQLLVWDVARGELRERLRGHDRGHVWGLQISADGRTLYSAGEDERALVWDLAGDRRLIRPFDAGPPFLVDPGDRSPRGIAVSPDGRTVAVTQTDGSVDLIDAQTLRPRRSVHALDGFAAAVAFSPDGQLLADRRRGRPGDAAGRAHAAARGRAAWTVDDRLRHSPSRPTAACSPPQSSARRPTTRHQTTAPCACGTCAGAPSPPCASR